MIDLTTLPVSSVPAAFDRGHLYSPTLDLTRYALDDRYVYDYRPGDLYEPMPAAPREPRAFAWWWKNVAQQIVADFLGLMPGDAITVQHVTYVLSAMVVETYRWGALVRYPMPKGAREPYAEMYVRRRNTAGHWYR
jgi:hypothetical protein